MITIDCPFCDGPLAMDEALVTVACDGCGVSIEIAPDPAPALSLEPAA
jgi:hypothetical protein